MELDDLNPLAQTQGRIYGLHSVLAALLVHLFARSDDIDDMTQELLNSAMSIIAKYELRGDNTSEERELVLSIMEATAMETITNCAQSGRTTQALRQRPGP